MFDFFLSAWEITQSLAAWLFLGMLVVGVLHRLIPPDLPSRVLGRSGLGSIVRAVLVGVPLPLCSCAVIPTAGALRQKGASRGASLAFLISTPQTGVDSIAVTTSFFGLPFAIFKVSVALVTGVVGGLLCEQENTTVVAPGHTAQAREPTLGYLDGLLHMIWRWLVVGIVVAAAIDVFAPPDIFAQAGLTGWRAMLGVLLISVPLYVCATSSVPIAAALVATGLPAGAAIVFLLAGPATNVATIGAVYRLLGRRSCLVYLTTVCGFSLIAGLLFEWTIMPAHVPGHTHAHEHGSLSRVAAVALLALFVRYALRELRGYLVPASGQSVTLHVTGIRCKGCASKIERELTAHSNVTGLCIDVAEGRVEIFGSNLSKSDLSQALEQLGFPPAPS